ncbi:MAG: CHASE domain-containing protein [Rhizobiaceae bacterium]
MAVYKNERAARQARFEIVADEVVDQIRTRVQQHIALVVATASHVAAIGGEVTKDRFRHFIEGLDLDDEFEGVQGIGLARILQEDQEAATSRRLTTDYGVEGAIWPPSNEAIRTAIVMLEPLDARNRAALGFDMYSEKRRREAISRAINTGEISVTAPVTLVQEITSLKQPGFLVYIPIGDEGSGRIDGFAYAPFRAGDLHRAALADQALPVEIETRDADAEEDAVLFTTEGFSESVTKGRLEVERHVALAGRTWAIRVRAGAAFRDQDEAPYALITALISLLLATALAAATRWQQQSVDRARALNAFAEQSVKEKELMLQEMKHRIKNSIARIMAMARQTASSSDSLDAFSESFSARLQSMSNAQDMLTRSHWQQTDLRELLKVELQQVYGSSLEEAEISGPPVKLNGRQTQALGLTFHELATNSLKYGAGAVEGGHVAISWSVTRQPGAARELHFVWDEHTGAPAEPPKRRGFGARLIDASIAGELGGSIDRDFHGKGLTITLRFPVDASAV